MSEAYRALLALLREQATLSSVATLLHWDQETGMPSAGAGGRAEEIALITRLAHERFTDPRVGDLLARSEEDHDLPADHDAAANLRELRREYDRACRIPAELVAEINLVCSQAVEAWKAARAAGDFAAFRPWLEKLIVLNRRKADCLGPPEGGEAYDALLDEFEPGVNSGQIESLFNPLRRELTSLIAEISAAHDGSSRALKGLRIPVDRQRVFNLTVLKRLGFDMNAGRMDVSVHPFSSGVGPGDTRITTRYREEDFLDSLGSTLHEAGHGLYEQGLPKGEHWGQTLGQPLGLGIHESQSRLWENHVGRSRAFWTWAPPEARQAFEPALNGCSVEDLYRATNEVKAHPIRVESDEVTYNLHIMLRFDLERALLRGDLAVPDLPGAWNERVSSDLGLKIENDARGCLQDIHWAMGALAYFPTYTLGNLYAAQFWEAIEGALPGLERQIARGEFSSLLGWLRENLHAHGMRFPTDEISVRLTGRPLSHEPLVSHLRGKFADLYEL